MLYRHGDVLVQRIEKLPEGVQRRQGTVLAYGELTGHSHRIADAGTVRLWSHRDETCVEVIADQALLVHDEHGPIQLPRGVYRSWMQREYTPQAIVRVLD